MSDNERDEGLDVLEAAFRMADAEREAKERETSAVEEPPAPGPEAAEEPAPPQPPKRKGRGYILLCAAAVLLAALAVAVWKMVPQGGGKNAVVYMTTDYDLMYLRDLKPGTNAALIADQTGFEISVTADGQSVYYTLGGKLYRIDLSRSGGKYVPEEIADSVIEFQALKSGGAIYLKDALNDSRLFWFDGWDSYALAEYVNQGFGVTEAETYVYYTSYDGCSSYYRVPLAADGGSELLVRDVYMIVYMSEDLLIYMRHENGSGGAYSLYSLVPGQEEVLLEDVDRILHVEAKEGETVITYVVNRSGDGVILDFGDVVQIVNGERREVLSNVRLLGSAFRDGTSIYIYSRRDDNSHTVYQNINGVESKLDGVDSAFYVIYILNDTEAVLWRHDGLYLSLTAYTIEDSQLKDPVEIIKDSYGYVEQGTYKGKDALYFYEFDGFDTAQLEDGDLYCYSNGEKMLLAEDAACVTVLPDSGAVFAFSDFFRSLHVKLNATLSTVEDGSSTVIAEGISVEDVVCLDAKQVLYQKGDNLYIWNGGDSELLAENVRNFWVPESACADSRMFYAQNYYLY